MYELKKDQFCKVAHLVRGELFPKPEVTSVIEGNNPGWIFVNDLSSPTTANAECEEQLQIPTILWDISLRRKGLFKRLMAVLVEFCNKYEQMPIIFTNTVPSFANLLMSHGGIELGDDNIAILPEKWQN